MECRFEPSQMLRKHVILSIPKYARKKGVEAHQGFLIFSVETCRKGKKIRSQRGWKRAANENFLRIY